MYGHTYSKSDKRYGEKGEIMYYQGRDEVYRNRSVDPTQNMTGF